MNLVAMLKDFAPEFETADIERLKRFIGYAELSINRVQFGDAADMATSLLAAHYLTMRDRKGVGGAITEQKAKDIQLSFATTPKDLELDLTSYGKLFKGLRRQFVTMQVV